jgi:hypothetical protein
MKRRVLESEPFLQEENCMSLIKKHRTGNCLGYAKEILQKTYI